MKAKTLSDIIISPVITEKSTILQESGKYTFKVSNDANKTSVKKSNRRTFRSKSCCCKYYFEKGKT